VTVDSTEPVMARMDVVRAMLFGVGKTPANWLHHYILVPAANLGFFLLSLVDDKWTWFSPLPVVEGLVIMLTIMFGLGALLFLWLRVWRSLAAEGARKRGAPCLATLSFLLLVLAAFSTAAFVVTVFVVPYDLHLANDVDAALLSMPPPGVGVRVIILAAFLFALLWSAARLCGLSLGGSRAGAQYARENRASDEEKGKIICDDSTKDSDQMPSEV